jgi:hypothetical protein
MHQVMIACVVNSLEKPFELLRKAMHQNKVGNVACLIFHVVRILSDNLSWKNAKYLQILSIDLCKCNENYQTFLFNTEGNQDIFHRCKNTPHKI